MCSDEFFLKHALGLASGIKEPLCATVSKKYLNPPISAKFIHFLPISAKCTVFCLIYVFSFPLF